MIYYSMYVCMCVCIGKIHIDLRLRLLGVMARDSRMDDVMEMLVIIHQHSKSVKFDWEEPFNVGQAIINHNSSFFLHNNYVEYIAFLVEKAQVDINHIDRNNTYSSESVLQIATNHTTLFAGVKPSYITKNILDGITVLCKKSPTRITRDTVLNRDDDNLTLPHNAAIVGDRHLFTFVFDLFHKYLLPMSTAPEFVLEFIIPSTATHSKSKTLLLVEYVLIGTAHNTEQAMTHHEGESVQTRDKCDSRGCLHLRAIMKLLLLNPSFMTDEDYKCVCRVECRECVDLFQHVASQPQRQLQLMKRTIDRLHDFVTPPHITNLDRALYVIIYKIVAPSLAKKNSSSSTHNVKKKRNTATPINKQSDCGVKNCTNRAAQYCTQCAVYYCKACYMVSECDKQNHDITVLSILRTAPFALSPTHHDDDDDDDDDDVEIVGDITRKTHTAYSHVLTDEQQPTIDDDHTTEKNDDDGNMMKVDVIDNNSNMNNDGEIERKYDDDAGEKKADTQPVNDDSGKKTTKKQRVDDNTAKDTAVDNDDDQNKKHT